MTTTLVCPITQVKPVYVLETERLMLRVPNQVDIAFDQKICLDERYKFMSTYKKPQLCYLSLLKCLEYWAKYGFGALTFEDKKTQEYFGKIFLHRKRPFANKDVDEWFMGFGISANAEGRGIAYEACVAARDWYLDVCKIDRFYIDPSPFNARSIALAKRLGGVFEGCMQDNYHGELQLWGVSNS